MKFTRSLPLWAVAFAVIPSVGHAASNVDAERERWVVHSRSGEAERGEAVAALRRLYDGSGRQTGTRRLNRTAYPGRTATGSTGGLRRLPS